MTLLPLKDESIHQVRPRGRVAREQITGLAEDILEAEHYPLFEHRYSMQGEQHIYAVQYEIKIRDKQPWWVKAISHLAVGMGVGGVYSLDVQDVPLSYIVQPFRESGNDMFQVKRVFERDKHIRLYSMV